MEEEQDKNVIIISRLTGIPTPMLRSIETCGGGGQYKGPGPMVWRGPELGILSGADFTVGAVWCEKGQDGRACVDTPTRLLPDEGMADC